MNGKMTGAGLTGDGGTMAGADSGGSGITMDVVPPAPEGPGLGMNTGVGDRLLIVLLQPLRRV